MCSLFGMPMLCWMIGLYPLFYPTNLYPTNLYLNSIFDDEASLQTY